MADDPETRDHENTDLAIVGMAAHLPGAGSIGDYWTHLRDGIESIRRLSEEELRDAGESPERLRDPHYVPAAAPLDGFADFDPEFFGLSAKEAAIMDPQHRQFLEVAWEALENAGHPPERFPGPVGVFAGCGMGSYFYFNLCSNRNLVDDEGMFLLRHTGNDKDFLSTRLSHILDLKGPSISLQTACSTSLVATHYAAQALLNGECDMAIAGGATIELPQGRGYIYKEGEILSPDGHCHAFDHRAQGTVFGSGAGAVVLRRLADAIEDGDHIWAVIKGTAVNNDGAAKAGYLAPSVEGQADAIAEAHAVAGVSAESIGYVECHGTGTYLGDPIEVAALSEAFRRTTKRTDFCRIGSVKTNIGHLDTAAGVASLIKAALALHHRQMPPSLGYETPNPAIDFEASPFRVNDRLTDWVADGPRRAGVNSLGVGGTNAHAVLEEAPARAPSDEADWPFQLLTVSARSTRALDANTQALAAHLRAHPEQPLADIAWTLREGRRAFEKRRVVVAETHEEAARLLEAKDPYRVFTHSVVGEAPEIVFMFPGGGAQYAGMARDLYETEPVFQEWMDRGLELLQARLDYDIRAIWLPEPGEEEAAEARLRKPSVQLPLIMIGEYALAQLFMSWGVRPAALVGHSMGENTAACLAGVMSFADCIGLVHLRGQLFDEVPSGGMLSIPLPLDEVKGLIGNDLDIASVNAPGLTAVSGPNAALEALEAQLRARDVECQRIPIDIAAHSRMLEPILDRFGDYLRSITLNPPQIPFLSNRSGAFISAAQATDPDYWVEHLRHTVHFADCISTLAATPERVYLEVGPGKALSSLAQAHGAVPRNQIISALRHPEEDIADDAYFLGVLGRLWATGAAIDWAQIWGEARRNRVPLPTYAFQRATYFVAPRETPAERPVPLPEKRADIADWGYRPGWRPRAADCAFDVIGALEEAPAANWLVFVDDTGLGDEAVARLRAAGHRVSAVRAGDAFARDASGDYTLAPERGREGYDALIRDLVARGNVPERIAHFWLVTREETFRPGASFFHRNLEQGFYSLLFLAQAIGDESLPMPLHLCVFTTGAAQTRDEPQPYPEKAAVMGPARVLPRELPGTSCAVLDLEMPPPVRRGLLAPRQRESGPPEDLVTAILEEMLAEPADTVATLRARRRFERLYRPAPLAEPQDNAGPGPEGAPWLITGGFGGIGLSIAEKLICERGARVALLARQPLPDRAQWEDTLRLSAPNDPVARRIRAVQHLESLGGAVLTLAADVCNLEQMRRALDAVTERFGPLHGVVHAAGAIDDAPLMTKTTGAVERVLAPKLHGTQVLDTLFPDGSLKVMVLCASTSTVTAPAGQVDYVAANEYLNAFARARAGGATRVVAINWGVWNEVGMAAEALAERTGTRPAMEPVAAGVPLLDEAQFDSAGNRVFTAQYDVHARWLLDEHRLRDGTAVVPGTGYLELAAQALEAHGETGPFELRDLYFFRPLAVPDAGGRALRLTLRRSAAGYRFEARSESTLDGQRGYVLNAQATLTPGAADVAQAPPPLDLGAIRARCPDTRTAPKGAALAAPQEAQLKFGPRWQVLREAALGAGEGLARLRLDERFFADLDAGFRLHPALLDIATGWALVLDDAYRANDLWVPVSYRRVRVHAPLPAELYSWARPAATDDRESGFASFDITLCNAAGEICVEIENFAMKRLATAEGFAGETPPTRSEIVFIDDDAPAGTGAQQPLSPGEQRMAYNVSQGIRPREGAEAFARALTLGHSQVVVSSLDLDALIEQAQHEEKSASISGLGFQRPDLDSDFVAPRNDIERTLAGFWQELLGLDEVGVEDSFFDLGGHSLIAVRLFAMIRRAYNLDFPISVLFEAPTIAACAAMIAERTGHNEEGDAAGVPVKPARRFAHLVAMHDGEGGPKTPFFLVAGMFGNVLNLRHLAQLMGADRPFYGVQARGLFGVDPPHRSLVEAATDYIAELRQVQPQGPYLLGGFSGGGITAFEMARQLEAQGEEVALLVLLDTPLPQIPEPDRLDRALIKAQELRRKGPGYLAEWARNRLAWELSKVRRRRQGTAETPEQQFHNTEIETAFREALARYEMQPWDGTVALFRPPLDRRWKVSSGRWVSAARQYVRDDNGWRDWAPATRVFEVPGDHDSMVLEPNVRVLATRIAACIEDAETRDTGVRTARAAE